MRERVGALRLPRAYLGYLCSRCTYSSLLYAWAFTAVIFCDSIFTKIQFTYRHFPDLVHPVAYTYIVVFSLIVLLGLLNLYVQKGYRIYVDRVMILVGIYVLSAMLSQVMNRHHMADTEPLHRLRLLLFPIIIAFFFVQTLDRARVRVVARVLVAFALVNLPFAFAGMYLGRGQGLVFSHVSAVFSDRNLLARFLSIAHAFLLIEFLARPSKRILSFSVGAMAAMFACVTLLLSRSGYGMYFFVNMLILSQSENKTLKRWLPVFAGIVLIVFGAMFYLRVRAEKMNIWPSSDIGRIGSILAGINMIKASPVYGVGYGMSIPRYVEFQDKHFPGLRDIDSIHNIYVNVFAEQGAVGLAVYLLLNAAVLSALWRVIRKEPFARRTLELWCFVSIATYLLHGIVYHTIDFEGIYWIIIALAVVCLRTRREAGRMAGAIPGRGSES
ncbi:MAG: hypothetical protein GF418_09965 [Chitinivibrionales bacterium]|nr:hypothetical protein [Chitinivibrionales bacterium]MBD3395937.1 hypothetical protein [Chitinivibrionales bacterium]